MAHSLQMGHFTYECKGDRVYVARESRGTVLKKKAKEIEKGEREAKSKKQEMEDEITTSEQQRNGLADRIILDRENERMEKQKRQAENDDDEDVSSVTTSSLDSSDNEEEASRNRSNRNTERPRRAVDQETHSRSPPRRISKSPSN
jgi:hypothetical protein